jgi:GntR family transcriptional repressor for pyruvate dehydrogenase complex
MLKKHPSVREDLLEFRELLESKAASHAAQRATEADREGLRLRFEALDAAFRENRDLDTLVALDLSFHQAIAEASHNVITAHLTASLLHLLRDHIRYNLAELLNRPSAWEALRLQHRNVWEAIDQQKETSAGHAAAVHINFVRENLAESMRREARNESAIRRFRNAPFGDAKE